jgi:AraC family transcriptional regulator
MDAIEYLEDDETRRVTVNTEASLVNRGFDIRLEHATWRSSGSALISTGSSCLMRLMLSNSPGDLGESGNFGAFCDQAPSRLKPLGDLIFFPRDTRFHLHHDSREQRAIVCVFDPNELGPLAAFDWDWKDCVKENMLDLRSRYLQAALQRLAEEVAEPGFASQLQTEYLLSSIALDLRRAYPDQSRPEALEQKLDARTLKRLRELIDELPEQALSLDYLARECGMPPRKLSIYFRNTVGKTLRRFAAETRLRKAMLLLQDPRLLIKQVAYQSGFQNAASFSAAFRKVSGMTPEAYRRRHGVPLPHCAAAGLARNAG